MAEPGRRNANAHRWEKPRRCGAGVRTMTFDPPKRPARRVVTGRKRSSVTGFVPVPAPKGTGLVAFESLHEERMIVLMRDDASVTRMWGQPETFAWRDEGTDRPRQYTPDFLVELADGSRAYRVPPASSRGSCSRSTTTARRRPFFARVRARSNVPTPSRWRARRCCASTCGMLPTSVPGSFRRDRRPRRILTPCSSEMSLIYPGTYRLYSNKSPSTCPWSVPLPLD